MYNKYVERGVKMKKIIKTLFMLVALISLSGCLDDKVISYDSKSEYSNIRFVNVDNHQTLFDNIQLAINEVSLVEVDFEFEDEENHLVGSFQVALQDTLKDIGLVLDANFNDEEFKIYIKNRMVWFSYPFKGISGGIKDTLDNFVDELPAILQEYDIDWGNEQEIRDALDKLDYRNVDLNELFKGYSVEYIKVNEAYELTLTKGKEVININLDKFYRPIRITSNEYHVNLTYPSQMELKYPANLEGFTYMSIKKALQTAGVNSVIDLIR